jgi:hypothetical protein
LTARLKRSALGEKKTSLIDGSRADQRQGAGMFKFVIFDVEKRAH